MPDRDKPESDDAHHQMATVQVAAGWVVLGLIVFSVVIRPESVQMVATLLGGLTAWIGLRIVNRNGKK